MHAATKPPKVLRVVLLANWGLGATIFRILDMMPEIKLILAVTNYNTSEEGDPWRNAVYDQAMQAQIPVKHEARFSHEDIFQYVQEERVDLVICHAHMKILPRKTFEAPRLGSLNIHASLLPKHKGPSPVKSAILAGDKQTGLTCHFISPEIDDGNIIHQISFPLLQEDTETDVIERQKTHIQELIKISIHKIMQPGFKGTPQVKN